MSEITELYRLERPASLDAVVGNSSTVLSIRGLIAKKAFPHSILLHGPSGCGKTTLARIIRTELGCADMDCTEVDSGTFRGIDTARALRESTLYSPQGGDCLVIIIDEAHKLTNEAQNALLKVLEDTPSHVYFMLLTTDPNKLIKALQTRLTPFQVNPLSDLEIARDILWPVITKRKLPVDKTVAKSIAMMCQGSPRAALVALQRVAALPKEQQAKAAEEAILAVDKAGNLARLLLDGKGWKEIALFLKATEEEPERLRRGVLGYITAVAVNSGNPALAAKCYSIGCSFEKPYYDTDRAGLFLSCYDAWKVVGVGK